MKDAEQPVLTIAQRLRQLSGENSSKTQSIAERLRACSSGSTGTRNRLSDELDHVLHPHNKSKAIIAAALGIPAVAAGIGLSLAKPPTYAAPSTPEPSRTTLSAIASPTSTETAIPTITTTKKTESSPTPTTTETAKKSLIEAFMEQLSKEADTRRTERQKADPEGYNNRIDKDLNQDTVNFLLYGYGVTNESALGDIIGSHTILSYNTKTKKIDLVSLTHDIRAPEIERYQEAKSGKKQFAAKIDGAFKTGGFDLQRVVVENATGYSVDFQVNMDDLFIRDLVDSVFGKLEIEDNPLAFDTQSFFLEGKRHDDTKHYPAGKVILENGFEVMRYMKSLPKDYDKSSERNVRKHLMFKALMKSIEQNYKNPVFLTRLAFLMRDETNNGRIKPDFDMMKLITDNLLSLSGEAARNLMSFVEPKQTSTMPSINRTVYVVNPGSGDGGVNWANLQPETQIDRDKGEYPSDSYAVPINGDPHAPNLPQNYWKSVRQLVITKILSKQ